MEVDEIWWMIIYNYIVIKNMGQIKWCRPTNWVNLLTICLLNYFFLLYLILYIFQNKKCTFEIYPPGPLNLTFKKTIIINFN